MALLRHPKVDTNKVERIRLSFCRLMTDEAVLHISNHCPNLTYISVFCCTLLTGAAIEALISNCNKITCIGVHTCNIEYIPENIGVQAPQLKLLDLRSNRIQVIPPSVALCNDGQLKLALHGNPIQTPPREIALDDHGLAKIDDIRSYYDEMKFGKPQECNEVKIVFIGHGEAGKTTTLNAIRGKKHPLTGPQNRTICVDHDIITLPRDNDRADLTVRSFDFGGQEFYECTQTPMVTKSALNFLCVNADETNPETYLRHLNQLQPRAPGAPLQIVLTKTDLVEDPEKKAQEVMENVRNRMETCIKQTTKAKTHAQQTIKKGKKFKKNKKAKVRAKDEHHHEEYKPLHILPNVICISVKNNPTEAKEKLIKCILEVSELIDLLPSVGQIIPDRWALLLRLLDAYRMYGDSISRQELFRKVRNQEVFDGEASCGCSKYFSWNIQDIVEKLCCFHNDVRRNMETNEEVGKFFCKIHEIEDLFQGYCEFVNATSEGMKIQDALNLFQAQGGIYIHGDVVFLQPRFVGNVMASLSDHRMTLEQVQNSEDLKKEIYLYIQKISDANDPDMFQTVKDGLVKFVTSGALVDSHVPRFLLWRQDAKLASPEYYLPIIRMLIDQGVIFLTSLAENRDDSYDATIEGIIAQHPIVLFRLPREPPPLNANLWPEPCPDSFQEESIYIELPYCPPNLPPIFAARLHSEGHCCYAWLKGAIVIMGGNMKRQRNQKSRKKIRIRADYQGQGNDVSVASIRLTVRSTADSFSAEEKIIIKKMLTFVREHQEENLPGLQYSVAVLCPECKQFKLPFNLDQGGSSSTTDAANNSGEEHEFFCEECSDHVCLSENLNLSSLPAAPDDSVTSTTDSSSMASSIQACHIEYQLMPKDQVNPGAVSPRDCIVMISFNDASAGLEAERVTKFLNDNGIKAFCTRVYCPNMIGSWRFVTVEGVVHCLYYVPLMTKGWQLSKECQFETQIAVNRFAKGELQVIPVKFVGDFDDEYDKREGHRYMLIWSSLQSVYKTADDTDDRWMSVLLRQLQAMESTWA